MSRSYHIVLTPEEGGYVASVPALPGCNTEGDTLDEAIANAREAIELYLEVLRDRGEPIPEEEGTPTIVRVDVAA